MTLIQSYQDDNETKPFNTWVTKECGTRFCVSNLDYIEKTDNHLKIVDYKKNVNNVKKDSPQDNLYESIREIQSKLKSNKSDYSVDFSYQNEANRPEDETDDLTVWVSRAYKSFEHKPIFRFVLVNDGIKTNKTNCHKNEITFGLLLVNIANEINNTDIGFNVEVLKYTVDKDDYIDNKPEKILHIYDYCTDESNVLQGDKAIIEHVNFECYQ